MFRTTLAFRSVEVGLAVLILADAMKVYQSGGHDIAAYEILLGLVFIGLLEGWRWLLPRLIAWADRKWHMCADEVFFRLVQIVIGAAMVGDAAFWLVTGGGLGVSQPGCLFALVALEGIIRRFVHPDPRPIQMALALKRTQARIRVFTQLPPSKVKQTLGLVRGISDIEAGSAMEFELAEQEALYLMLRQALSLGANAVIDARLTTATYETSGSGWQVARPVYTGTAVRV